MQWQRTEKHSNLRLASWLLADACVCAWANDLCMHGNVGDNGELVEWGRWAWCEYVYVCWGESEQNCQILDFYFKLLLQFFLLFCFNFPQVMSWILVWKHSSAYASFSLLLLLYRIRRSIYSTNYLYDRDSLFVWQWGQLLFDILITKFILIFLKTSKTF